MVASVLVSEPHPTKANDGRTRRTARASRLMLLRMNGRMGAKERERLNRHSSPLLPVQAACKSQREVYLPQPPVNTVF